MSLLPNVLGPKIEGWLKENTIIDGTYTINEDLSIDVHGNIKIVLSNVDESHIKRMRIIQGNFNCSGCESLESLEGAPKEIGGSFYCEMCTKLSSLKGAPQKVHGNFNCSGCENLESLEGAPEEVDGHFVCLGTRFSEEDVRNVVKVKGNVYCSK